MLFMLTFPYLYIRNRAASRKLRSNFAGCGSFVDAPAVSIRKN
jgi:hypothetical protein